MVSAAPVWFTMLVQFVVAMVATISFGITFQVGRRHYWTCGFVGAVGWTIYIACTTLGGMTAPMATLIATLPLAALSRFFAIRHKAPITVFLLTGIFPLVPGAGIYYTAYYFLRNDRALCTREGIWSSDVILVPIEDGDRAQALIAMGKKVISIDINPLSRTSRVATVPICDEISRATANILRFVEEMRDDRSARLKMLDGFSNRECLRATVDSICGSLKAEFE